MVDRPSISPTVAGSLAESAGTVLVDGEAALRARRVLASPGARSEAYPLVEILGRGGMGAVWLAIDPVLGREVALKIVLDRHPALVARFLTEVRVTGGLDHPGIVRVHDFGADREGRPYFTMIRVQGRPWSDRIAGQTLPERLDVFQKVAEAVGHAHSRGVIHRDLKPANVLVGENGEVVVADWGLARILGTAEATAGDAGAGSASRGLTAAGSMMGTPGYAAPEQLDGDLERMGPATDVHALGSILHECLAGEPAFAGRTVARVLEAQRALEVTPLPPGTPRELAAIARKALRSDPEDRYRSVADLLEDLDRWRGGFPVAALPVSRFARAAKLVRRHSILASLLAAVLAGLPVAAAVIGLRLEGARRDREAEASRRRESARNSLVEVLEPGEAALDEAERSDPEEARALLELARSFLQRVRTREREVPAADRSEELVPLVARAEAGLVRAKVLEALRLLAARRTPLADRLAEVRRQAALWSDVEAAVLDARAAGATDPRLDAALREARGPGPLTIRTDPPGAAVAIHRLGNEAVEPGELVATVQGDGRTIELDAGGYLLLLTHPDREPCRLPIHLRRGDDRGRSVDVSLPARGDVPAGFAFVPPGPWLRGESLEPVESPQGFLIAIAELTWGEWEEYGRAHADDKTLGFLDHLRLARPDDWRDLPVCAVSHDDFLRYCEWRSARDPRFDYRLPTSDEWERAARGADGRLHPWGDRWDPDLCNHRAHHAGHAGEKVLEPAAGGRWIGGRSVFGLLRTAGNVREWTATLDGDPFRVTRGSSAVGAPAHTRAWFADSSSRISRNSFCGARLVAFRRIR